MTDVVLETNKLCQLEISTVLLATQLTVFFQGSKLKMSKLNGSFQRLPLYFSTKFTIQNTEEESQICFIVRTATKRKKQMKPTH